MTQTVGAALDRANNGDPSAQLALSRYFFERNDLPSARLWAGRAADAGWTDALLPAAQLELVALAQGGRLAAAERRALAAVTAQVAQAFPVLAMIRILRAPEVDSGLVQAVDLLRDQVRSSALVQELKTIGEFRGGLRTPKPHRLAAGVVQVGAQGGFLPDSVLLWLDDLSRPLLRPAQVIDPQTGQRTLHPIRRGEQAVLDWQRLDPVAAVVLRLVAEAAGRDWRCCEPINLLRYPVGGEYRLHHDCFEHDPLIRASRSGARALNQRATTALLYLNEDLAGGATTFPALGIEVPPRRSRLLVFENLRDGQPDPAMRHAGMPVLSGEKRVLSFWFREHALVDLPHAIETHPEADR
ncbi:MAG: 2OG-Fe(II) oxygenase [Xanthomonadales bacterium PRO6]|nr:hypothetical protein [Xanthomonadales bacterium]MCE7932371.1 2OG-Fe(II) oxygenase [Xanthomonadales bacterium PRO6]